MNLSALYDKFLIACMILLALLTLIAIIRSILGPKTADRIIAVNMIGTITMALIALLTIYLGEDYLADVCLIYAMVSFLAVVVLSKIFTGIYREKKAEEQTAPITGDFPENSVKKYQEEASGKLTEETTVDAEPPAEPVSPAISQKGGIR